MNSKQCLRQEDLSLVQPIEILIADAKVEDLHILLAGMRANVQLHLITDSDQAPCQVAKALSTPGLDTLHLLGHGSPGEVILGGWRMNLESLNDIQSVMNEDASKLQSVYSQNNNLEICLWSCRTGAGEKGKQFMNTLADMTNATIFASETLVGNQVKGGSWDLNVQSSPKNGSPFAKDSMEQYDKVLIGSSSNLGQILSGIPGPGFYSPGTWTFEIERESGYFYDVQAGVGGGLPRIKFTIGGETAYAEFTEVNLSGNLVFTYEGPLTGAIAWFSNTAVDNFDLNGSTIDIYDGSDFESANKINTIDTDVEFVPDLPDGTNLPSFVGVLMADVATIPSGGADLTDATGYALEANELVIGTDNDVVLSGQSTDWTVNVTVVRTDDGVNHLGYVFSNQDGKSVTVYGDVGSVGFTEMSGQLAKLTLTYHPLNADGGLSELYGEISLPSSIARLNIDPDAAGSITVSASSTGNQTIVGAVTDSDTFDADYGLINYREDVVLLPFKYQDVSIQTASINLIGDGSNESVIQISAGDATKTLYGVEKIQFTAEGSDISELAIIGAGGYDNLSVATTQANTSHISEDAHVFISNSANTETQDIVNVNNLTLIVENGRTAGAYDLKLAEDAAIQTISLEGSGTINVTGNAFDNTIYDNSATNILSGGAGDDIIYSRNGADTLSGGEGNDTFDITDTSGNDTDITDLGESDTLKVISDGDVTAEVASDWTASAATDNNADKTDVVINTNGYNVDLSAATTTAGFTINSDAEGADGSTITGSNQADVITGNANGGTDTIDAGAGDDEITFTQATVTGSDGTDTFNVVGGSNSTNSITDLSGSDTLTVSVGGGVTAELTDNWDASAATDNNADKTDVVINTNGYNVDLSAATTTTAGFTINSDAEGADGSTITGSNQADVITGNANGGTDTIDAGAGDDEITFTQATVTGSDGTDTFNVVGGSNSTNSITDLSGSDTLTVSVGGGVTAELTDNWDASAATDNNADKTDVVINTNGYNVDLSAATTTTAGFTINSDAEGADGSTITGSNQADVITGNANGGTDTIDAGAGDDEITFTQATVTGSDGTDTFNVVGGSNSTNSITDLSGSDTLTVSVGGGVTAELTDNWDASAATDNNADKTDVVINTNGYNVDLSAATTTTAGFTINSDAEGADGSTITGSNQADVITGNANGGTDTIDAGAGDDEITFTQATVTGSDGTDTFNVVGGSNSTNSITDLSGSDTLTVSVGGGVTAELTDNWDASAATDNNADKTDVVINTNGYNVDLSAATTTTAGFTINSDAEGADGSTITGSNQADVITGNANGGTDTIDAGAGDDEITFTQATVTGSDGTDTFNVVGGSNSTNSITDLSGSDTLTVSVGGGVTAELTDNWDASAATDNNADKTDVVINTNGYNVDLSAATTTTAGFTINSDAEGADGSTITGSNQADVITGNANGGTDTIDAGAGNDVIYSGSGDDTIDAGSGDDTVYLRLDQALTIQDLPAFLEAAFGVDGEGNITISNDYSTDDIEGADLHLSGADTLIGVETIGLWFSDYSDALLVRIVSSQSSYTTINQATSAPLVGSDTSIIYVQDTGTIDKDDGNSGLIDFSGEGVAAKVVLIFAAGDDGATLDLAMNGAGTLSIYGTRDYTLTGSSGADTIFDFTSTAIASTVNAGDGNDNIYVIGNNNIVTINGGSGDDVIVGGTADKLYGGAGADTVVALHGSAYLSGGAGNDNLVNAYLGSATSNDMVTMVGGSGTDKFMLLAADRTNGSIIGDDGTNNMNTFISDLASGDTINLSALFGSVNDVDGNLAKSSFSLANGVSRDALGTRLDIGGIGADVSSDTANNAESAELGATSYIRVGGATLSKTSDALIFNTTNLSFDSLVGNEIGDLYPIS